MSFRIIQIATSNLFSNLSYIHSITMHYLYIAVLLHLKWSHWFLNLLIWSEPMKMSLIQSLLKLRGYSLCRLQPSKCLYYLMHYYYLAHGLQTRILPSSEKSVEFNWIFCPSTILTVEEKNVEVGDGRKNNNTISNKSMFSNLRWKKRFGIRASQKNSGEKKIVKL